MCSKKTDMKLSLCLKQGTYGFDDHSLGKDFLNGKNLEVFNDAKSDFNVHLKNIKKASEVNADYQVNVT